MHGTILVLLKRFVTHQFDFATWHRLVALTGITEADFEIKGLYPDEHLYKLVGVAAEHVGISPMVLQEKFGEFLVPDLLFMYRKLIQPDWRTLDFLVHTEGVMHTAVRRDMSGSAPPVLDVERLSPGSVRVRYVSPRRMGALAVGIVRGIAHHYGEEDQLRITPITSESGESVEILIERVERPVKAGAVAV